MEKRTPNCRLSTVKALIAENKVRMTGTALAGAANLDLYATGIINVYRPNTPAGRVYLKLTVIDDVLIVSFKALEE